MRSEDHRGRAAGFIRKAGAALGGLLFALLALEVGLRLFVPAPGPPDPDWAPRWDDPVEGRHPRVRMNPFPGLDYDMVPGSESATTFPFGPGKERRVVYRINSLGIRDDEYSLTPPEGAYRICVLGDSFTYGLGVNLEDTYPKEMERAFAEALPDQRVEVLNCGIFNYNTREEVLFYANVVQHFEPDLVLLSFMVNDTLTRNLFDTVTDPDGRTRRVVSKTARQVTPESRLIFEYGLKSRPGVQAMDDWNPTRKQRLAYELRSRSRLVDWLAHRLYLYLDNAAYVAGQRQSFEDGSAGWTEVTKYLRRADEHMESSGVDFHMTWIPWPKGIRDGDYLFRREHDKLRDFAGELGVPFHEVLDAVIDVPTEELVAHPMDAHLSPLGNRLVGRRLAEELLPAVRAGLERRRASGQH